jgi:cobalt-zinc-cadmium efflux system protein
VAHDHHHAHHHHHGHGHHHHHHGSRALGWAFSLNALFTLIEIAGAWWTHSAAVLSGALHDVGDCLVLAAAWYFQRIAARGRDARYSFGYARYGMLGGWGAALVLCIGSIGMIGYTLIHWTKRHEAEEPLSTGIMAVAGFGLVMNFFAMWVLRGGHSLNERGARLHLIEDVLSWAAVLVGGTIMHFTAWTWLDPLMSIAIAVFILINAVRVLREGTAILMQGQPTGIDEKRIERTLRALPDVVDVHDQHAWTLDGHYTVLTVHIVTSVGDPARIRAVKEAAHKALEGFGVQHATIEIEQADESCSLQHH